MKNKKILIVDDEADILEFLSYNFAKQGYEVFTSLDGKDGLLKAKSIVPNAIIADIRMPGINGIEMCRKLRQEQQPQIKNIPVLFITADNDEYLALSAHHAGGTHYITKPIKTELLLNMVQEMIEDRINE